jgi:hypothetical protein
MPLTNSHVQPRPSPASRLYSHALESIFAFFTLRELAAIVCVCRDWQVSVFRMRPINCRIKTRDMRWVKKQTSSLLRRHIAHMDNRAGSVATK